MHDAPHIIRPPGPKWLRLAVGIAGSVYLVAIFLGSAGSSVPAKSLPRPLLYFTQVACLFPRAATHTIEYRAAAYSCRERSFQELDYRTYFPLRPDDKENRYHRVARFYRNNRRVMQALDEHLVEKHNARVERGESPDDGIEGPIGGILVMSLRIPLPEPGTQVDRFRRTQLTEVPVEWRKSWYRTPRSRRDERCAGKTQ
jgi:hypothetical protein